MSKVNQHAFSLIELMVVIAIVAVLSAIAIPAYKEYIERAKMQTVHNIIQQQMELWTNTHNLGDWNNLDPNRPVTTPGINLIYLQWQEIAIHFYGGYFDRVAISVVRYTPVVDGQPVDPNGSVSQLDGNIISWNCDVSGPATVYADGINILEFQKRYFPSCTCLTC